MRTKSKRWIAGMAAAGCATLTMAGIGGRAQHRNSFALPRYVLLEREAVVAQAPQVVAEGSADLAAWSPDGRCVIAFRVAAIDARLDLQTQEAPAVEASIVVWNLAAKHGLTVWKHRGQPSDGRFTTRHLEWLPGGQTALVTMEWLERSLQPDAQGAQKIVETPHYALLFIDAARNQVREVPQLSWPSYATSPTKPQIALHDAGNGTARVLDSSGAFGPLLALPKDLNASVEWMPDGSALLLRWFEKLAVDKADGKAAGVAKQTQRYARMDAVTGAITRLDKRPAGLSEKASPAIGYSGPLHVRQTTQLLSEGAARHRVHPLWLECDAKSDQARTLLCADGSEGQIAPRGDAVLYLSQGVAWVTPLTRIPREAFVQALRAVTMSNARQAGLALIMYSQDYDEVLPSSGDVVSPYLKNDDILDGLNYTYGGGAVGDIKKPSETILGTFPGPGGVAVIYADGHVQWKDK